MPIEEARDLLNKAVAGLLSEEGFSAEQKDSQLQKFIKDHRGSINRAWLIEDYQPYNDLFEYIIQERIGHGAFSNVFIAKSKGDNKKYALKMLREECLRQTEFLNCFRRGARSMQILTQKNVFGMVPFHKAFEIPACIVMDHVEGKTLESAVKENYLQDLVTCLNVLVKTAEIVENGHKLKEQVLHRDLKPSNVMLRNIKFGDNNLDVVVLDFDLSWHQGAYGLSVVEGAHAQGYAAPEQTRTQAKPEIAAFSTRHTGVDVFGLGMIAFYVFTGRDPRANEHQFPDFRKTIVDGIMRRLKGIPDWKLLPEELADLVLHCTKEKQSERPPFGDIVRSLYIFKQIAQTSIIAINNPMLLKEIVYRISGPEAKMDSSDFDRNISCESGHKKYLLSLVALKSNPAIKFRIERPHIQSDDRKTINKYMKVKVEKVAARLKTHQGKEINMDSGIDCCFVEAIFQPKDTTPKGVQNLADVFTEALTNFEI